MIVVALVFIVFLVLAMPSMKALGEAQAEDELDRRYGEQHRRNHP